MFFSDVYTQEMEKANRPRCIHVNPQTAEYVMGYPVDWTSRSTSPTTATIPEHPAACFTGGSLFAGVGGLDLGLQKVVVTKIYCEIDPAAADVLQRRMDDGFLHRGGKSILMYETFQRRPCPASSFSSEVVLVQTSQSAVPKLDLEAFGLLCLHISSLRRRRATPSSCSERT